MTEIEAAFVYNERRRFIWQRLGDYLELLKPINEVRVIYIDGSFTTDKEEPGDVDVVVEFTGFAKMLKLLEAHRNLFDNKIIKQDYPIDLYPRSKQMPGFAHDLLGFFQYMRIEEVIRRNMPRDAKKGVLAVKFKAK
jgi:predicted nucleotidyltransferase